MKQSKNYIGFVNDHSGSMAGLAAAATNDYNATIAAIKDSASREMLDTVVSVVGIGLGSGVERQVVISNPHVLKPVTNWPTPGGTPLYDGIGDILELFQSLPDARESHVSFLVIITTDGHELSSRKYNATSIRALIERVQNTGQYTIVFRVPKGYANSVSHLGVAGGNIQEWETSVAGMAASTKVQAEAVSNYFSVRSSGVRGSNTFYADATKVDAKVLAATLKDIQKDVSLYVVPVQNNGIEIRPFILTKRMQYLKGSAFYQLTKTEARVSETKLVAIRDKTTGAIYSGLEARKLIGMPEKGNARLHPGDHGNFDIFIQSESTNRKLVGGTGVLYWEAIGKPFTAADEAYLLPKPVAPAVVVLPAVAPTNRPTPSPIPVAKKVVVAPVPVAPVATPLAVAGRQRYSVPNRVTDAFFNTRDEARAFAEAHKDKKFSQKDAGPTAPRGKRWYVAK